MILRRFTIYLSVIILVSACYSIDKPKKPDNLISKEKMVDILIDAKLIASANSKNRKVMENRGVKLNTYVFTKHNIDSLQFALSNEYYAFYIKDYEEIYAKVKDSLEFLNVKFKEEEEKIRIEDSLKLVSKKKDSLNLLKIKDSLKVLGIKDSLTEIPVQKTLKEENRLISPISSDKNRQ
ncbi:DUF4296 domain-containing protein [Flavivirga aquimarina]|uniref:DUF4296 domain-containing protein n=1 Tax=Flavivirga aquimarina TaxID=2027862 RepID=A0ABT8WC59_9FLAO|nr:DUF4296 domain-containing protein [Flavivirga aquimarina]MDO5970657.1 DUF4296 domain-containing protein [Flavivirga aquimarina]